MSLTPPRARAHGRTAPLVVLTVAVAVLIVELAVVKASFGTNDILHWQDFAGAIRQHGPVGIYGAPIPRSYYNHPPLMGYVLEVVNGLKDLGIPVRISIRTLASVSGVLCALLVFVLVRKRRTEREALAAGILVAVSPVLFTISAFHGNTDPIFTMLTLGGAYLLVDRKWPGWAGAVIAIAIGVKVVVVVAVPALLVYAALSGRRVLTRFVGVGLIVFAITWGPALVFDGAHMVKHVLDYPGLGLAQWGFMQFGHWAGNPWWVHWAQQPGRLLIVAACGVIPALGVWRRPESVVTATALAFCAFLVVSPAFAVQYLAWAAAASFLLSFWGGVAYNLVAGILLVQIYDRWSGNRFFGTFQGVAFYHPMTPHEVVLGMLAWGALLLTCWAGVRRIWSEPAPSAVAEPDPREGQAVGTVPSGDRADAEMRVSRSPH